MAAASARRIPAISRLHHGPEGALAQSQTHRTPQTPTGRRRRRELSTRAAPAAGPRAAVVPRGPVPRERRPGGCDSSHRYRTWERCHADDAPHSLGIRIGIRMAGEEDITQHCLGTGTGRGFAPRKPHGSPRLVPPLENIVRSMAGAPSTTPSLAAVTQSGSFLAGASSRVSPVALLTGS